MTGASLVRCDACELWRDRSIPNTPIAKSPAIAIGIIRFRNRPAAAAGIRFFGGCCAAVLIADSAGCAMTGAVTGAGRGGGAGAATVPGAAGAGIDGTTTGGLGAGTTGGAGLATTGGAVTGGMV